MVLLLCWVDNKDSSRVLLNLWLKSIAIIMRLVFTASSIKRHSLHSVTDFSDTLSLAKQIITYIRRNALRHRQFRALLDDSEESLEDVLFNTPVRWLSQGRIACRVLNQRREISTFYST